MPPELLTPCPAAFVPRVLRTDPRDRHLEHTLQQGLLQRAPRRPWLLIEAEARRLTLLLDARRRNDHGG